jgi:hypothetical protein
MLDYLQSKDPNDLFIDHCHLSSHGNTIVADELFRFLNSEKLI